MRSFRCFAIRFNFQVRLLIFAYFGTLKYLSVFLLEVVFELSHAFGLVIEDNLTGKFIARRIWAGWAESATFTQFIFATSPFQSCWLVWFSSIGKFQVSFWLIFSFYSVFFCGGRYCSVRAEFLEKVFSGRSWFWKVLKLDIFKRLPGHDGIDRAIESVHSTHKLV